MVRLRGIEFNGNESAGRVSLNDPYVQEAIESIASRAALVGDGERTANFCRPSCCEKRKHGSAMHKIDPADVRLLIMLVSAW